MNKTRTIKKKEQNIKKDKNIFYSQIPIKDRKKLRVSLEKLLEIEKKKKVLLEKLFIKPTDECISLYKDFFKNKISLRYLQNRRSKLKIYLENALGMFNKNIKSKR